MPEGSHPEQPPDGENALLSGGRGDVHKDLKLLGHAVRKRWNIPEAIKEDVVKRVAGVVQASEDERNAVKAAQVLVAMDRANQADEHLERKIAAGLEQREGQGVTVNVAVGVNVEQPLSAEERDRRIAAILMGASDRGGAERNLPADEPTENPVLPTQPAPEANGVPKPPVP